MNDTKHWVERLQAKDDIICTLEKVITKLQRFPFEPICLLCGRLTPCMTDEEGIKNGGPGKPCTFEPTPKQLFDDCERLRNGIKISNNLLAQKILKIKELENVRDELTKRWEETHQIKDKQINILLTNIEELKKELKSCRATLDGEPCNYDFQKEAADMSDYAAKCLKEKEKIIKEKEEIIKDIEEITKDMDSWRIRAEQAGDCLP